MKESRLLKVIQELSNILGLKNITGFQRALWLLIITSGYVMILCSLVHLPQLVYKPFQKNKSQPSTPLPGSQAGMSVLPSYCREEKPSLRV